MKTFAKLIAFVAVASLPFAAFADDKAPAADKDKAAAAPAKDAKDAKGAKDAKAPAKDAKDKDAKDAKAAPAK
jgi:hypothetical protein